MKNFKKISRKELKSLIGGKSYLGDGGLSSGGENTYKCCTDLYLAVHVVLAVIVHQVSF